MNWLQVLPTLDPRSGGPIEGVRNLGEYLLGAGHAVEVVSLDDPCAPYLENFPLPVHALGPAAGGYRYCRKYVPWLKAHAHEFDAVIVNGIWQFSSFGAARALRGTGVPYYVFTHGMLDPWFKHTYPIKHLKKWLYWPWGDYRVLRDAEAVLFTCDEERRLARQSFWLYSAREEVVGYGIRPPPPDSAFLREQFLAAYPHLQRKRVLLFLGRIHPKKGCDVLVKSFARIANVDPSLWLVVAGPDETGWVAGLKSLAQSLGVADRILWPGMLRTDAKWGAFHASEAFILPSHQENFGVAVAEAMACGKPVLISDKINIWREIDNDQAGLVDVDTVAGTERTLRRWLDLSAQERHAMGLRASQSFLRRFTIESTATALIEVARRSAAKELGIAKT
jgi:glycosyltransferase involved in cell wall biosynthesis